MDIKALQWELAAFVVDRGLDPLHTPKNLSMALAAEAGTLLALFKWLADDGAAGLGAPAQRNAAADALADSVLHAIHLADRLGIDLDEAIRRKLARNAEKYPPQPEEAPAPAPAPAAAAPQSRVAVERRAVAERRITPDRRVAPEQRSEPERRVAPDRRAGSERRSSAPRAPAAAEPGSASSCRAAAGVRSAAARRGSKRRRARGSPSRHRLHRRPSRWGRNPLSLALRPSHRRHPLLLAPPGPNRHLRPRRSRRRTDRTRTLTPTRRDGW